jgi:serine/threonine-protein kinase
MTNQSQLALGLLLFSAGLKAWAEPPPRFPSAAVWHQDIRTHPLHPDSAAMIATLDSLGGFGGADFRRMQIDFSLQVVHAGPGAPTRALVAHDDGYYSPDCDPVGSEIPVPANAAIEGVDGLDCDNDSNDCHLLVVQDSMLYETFRATRVGETSLEAQCLAIWRLDVIYPPEGRGEHCTSADAAGLPIAPLLFNADEIASSLVADPQGGGDLGHAIRFIIRNERMASDDALGGVGGRLYVRPASHAGNPHGPDGSVPYGARLRLRSDFPLDGYNPAARVILNTFKRFGIVLADGGNIALTAESDRYTDTKWADLDVGSRVFDQTPGALDVDVTDFEVLDTGPRIGETWNCVRSVLPEPQLLADGFETAD